MKRTIQAALLLAAAAGCFWLWGVLFPSDETRIQRALDALEETVSFDSSEGNLAKFGNAAKLSGFFATNVVIDISTWNNRQIKLEGRQEIQRTALAARNAVTWLEVRFVDRTLRVRPEHLSATAHFAVIAKTGQEGELVQEVETSWKKSNGDWLIQHVKTVEAIRR